MEAEEKMEEMNNLNMHNDEIAESEEMKERFMNIFSVNNDYSMPLDIAWQTFKAIIKRLKEDITPDDVEKIASLCIDVKKEYYENVRGIITDNNGNPDIQANVNANTNFLDENPDIQVAAEMNLAKDEFKNIMDESEPDKFWDKFMNLSEDEKDEFEENFWTEFINLYNNEKAEKDSSLQEQNSGEELNEDSNTKSIEEQAIEKLKGFIESKGGITNFAKEKKLTKDDKIQLLKIISPLAKSENPKYQQYFVMALRKIIPEEEINLFFSNKGEFFNRLRGHVNSLTDKSYDLIDEFFEEAKDELYIPVYEENIDISHVQEEFLEKFVQHAQNMKIERTNIQEKLDSKLEIDIFKELSKINLSQDENVVIFLKLYKDLEGRKRYSTEDAKERAESIKNVLKEMIFAPENAGVFGNYLDTFKDGSVKINEAKVENDAEKLKEQYKKIHSETQTFLHSRDKNPKYQIEAGFKSAEELTLKSLNKKELLSEYIAKKEQLEIEQDPNTRMEIEGKVLETERKMSKLKEFSTFYSSGRVDFEAVKNYYEYAYGSDTEHGADEKLEDVIVKFCELEKTVDRSKIAKMDSLKRDAFDKILPGEDYEYYRETADAYVNDYCDRKAIETVYSSYINGKNVDNMKRMEAISYIRALGYLYSSEIPEMKEFAENMIKQNFSSVVLAEDGRVDKEKFGLLYNSYHSTELGRTFENATAIYQKDIKNSISRSKKFDFSRSGMEFSDDLKRINESFRDSTHINVGAKTEFSEKEQEIVNKLKGSVNLEDIKDIETIVLITASLEKKVGKEDFSEEDRLLLTTIRKFATSSENRIYFEKYLGTNDLKTSSVIKEFNPAIVDALGYEGELETYDVEKLRNEKYLQSDDLGDVTTVLECVFSYGKNIEQLEKKLKLMQVAEHESTSIFRKDGKLDGEFDEKRLADLISSIDNVSELEAHKKKLAETMAKSLRNSDIIEEFSEAFEVFIESAYLVMKDITKDDKSFTDEEKKIDENFRKNELQEREDATWEDVQEALRRMEERNPSKHFVNDNPAINSEERRSKIERAENGEFVTDEEFVSVLKDIYTELTWERFQVILQTMEEKNPSERLADGDIDTQKSKDYLKRKMTEYNEKNDNGEVPVGDGELNGLELNEEQLDFNGDSDNKTLAENLQVGEESKGRNTEELDENETLNTLENNTAEVPLENVVAQAENIVSTNTDGSDKTQKVGLLETLKNKIIEILDKIKFGTSEEKEAGKINLIKIIKDFFNRKNEQPKLEEGKSESNKNTETPSFDEKYAYKDDELEAKALKESEVQKAKAEQMMESGEPTQSDPSKELANL